MLWIVMAFIGFPLLGLQFFGGIGFFGGLIAAILYAVFMKKSSKWEKKMDEWEKKMDEAIKTAEERNERIKQLKAEGKPLSKWEAAIRADTERRKQKRLEKKLAKQRAKTESESTQ